jgi:hypothetical protein
VLPVQFAQALGGVFRQAYTCYLLVPTSPPTPHKGEIAGVGFFLGKSMSDVTLVARKSGYKAVIYWLQCKEIEAFERGNHEAFAMWSAMLKIAHDDDMATIAKGLENGQG